MCDSVCRTCYLDELDIQGCQQRVGGVQLHTLSLLLLRYVQRPPACQISHTCRTTPGQSRDKFRAAVVLLLATMLPILGVAACHYCAVLALVYRTAAVAATLDAQFCLDATVAVMWTVCSSPLECWQRLWLASGNLL
jgi:hypothetical protein